MYLVTQLHNPGNVRKLMNVQLHVWERCLSYTYKLLVIQRPGSKMSFNCVGGANIVIFCSCAKASFISIHETPKQICDYIQWYNFLHIYKRKLYNIFDCTLTGTNQGTQNPARTCSRGLCAGILIETVHLTEHQFYPLELINFSKNSYRF